MAGQKESSSVTQTAELLPNELSQAIKHVRRDIPKVPLGIHVHNDGGLAVANTLRAVEEGVIQVHGTINGIGERCGNVDLTAIMSNLELKMGYQCCRKETLRA